VRSPASSSTGKASPTTPGADLYRSIVNHTGETPEEVAAIEHEILPKMIVAGFSTVTITSVIVTSIIVGHIGS